MKKFSGICFACFFLLLPCSLLAQKDSIILKNKDVVVGEIKSMDRGVLIIETPYSKNDFEIKWNGISELYTKSVFLIFHKNGDRRNGLIRSVPGTDSVMIMEAEGKIDRYQIEDIVFLLGLKSSFWSRLKGNIDLGLTITKANNLRQFNVGAGLSYTANNWQLSGTYNGNSSRQDSVQPTKRTEVNVDFKYFLPHDWFVNVGLNFLSNTEQGLKLRTTGKLGGGKYFVHTNQKYWGAGMGVSLNNETFNNEKSSRNSAEIYAATELNLFDVKNIDLLANIYVYRSLTESGRWRSDMKFNLKYDLPWNFYVKPGFTLNYDNRPAIAGNETDYVITFAFGWEL